MVRTPFFNGHDSLKHSYSRGSACSVQTSPGSSSGTEVPEQTKETKLVVYFKDGNQMKFPLNENPLISFVNGQLVIKTNGREEQYDLQTLLRFAYE